MSTFRQIGVHFKEIFEVSLLAFSQGPVQFFLLLFLIIRLTHYQIHVESGYILPRLTTSTLGSQDLLLVIYMTPQLFLSTFVNLIEQFGRDECVIDHHAPSITSLILNLLHFAENFLSCTGHIFIVMLLL